MKKIKASVPFTIPSTPPIVGKEVVPAVQVNASELTKQIDLLVKEMVSTRKAAGSMYEAQSEVLRVKTLEAGKLIARLRDEADKITYSKGFYKGRKYIVSTAEDKMAQNLGYKTVDELAASGKMPAWWIATLVTCLTNPPPVLDFTEDEKG